MEHSGCMDVFSSHRMLDDQVFLDDVPADQVLLNDPLEYRRVAVSVPGALGIDHGDWPTLTHP